MNSSGTPGAVDVHQHLWPVSLLAELLRRRRAPFIRNDDDGWSLVVDGEPTWAVDLGDHDPVRRAGLAAEDGLDLAVVALSSPLGIEALPTRQARDLIDAYHDGVRDLPSGLRAWAAASLAAPDLADLAARLDEGFVGLCLPAAAIASPRGASRIAPLLRVLDEREAPLFVHPGPAPWGPRPANDASLPRWWPAMTSYVAQMQAAWLGFRCWVRPARPRLRVCFAMLAGLAPLQAERLASRTGDAPVDDPAAFYDTSSYGPAAIAAMVAAVGTGALVHGSDRPVVLPRPTGGPDDHAHRVANPGRLLTLQEVHA